MPGTASDQHGRPLFVLADQVGKAKGKAKLPSQHRIEIGEVRRRDAIRRIVVLRIDGADLIAHGVKQPDVLLS